MKNGLKLVVAISLMFAVGFTHAQIKIGPKIGLNASTLTMETSGLAMVPITVPGVNVGIVTEIPLEKNVALQPGVLYSTKGSKYNVYGTKMSILPTYIEIPFNVMYRHSLGKKDLLAFAGPYFGTGFGGKYDLPSNADDIKYGSGSNDDLRPFDFGLNLGAGIEMSHFQVTAQYGFSLTNLAPVQTNKQEMRNRVFGISVAYLMGGK